MMLYSCTQMATVGVKGLTSRPVIREAAWQAISRLDRSSVFTSQEAVAHTYTNLVGNILQ